jgi:hypothetical protein
MDQSNIMKMLLKKVPKQGTTSRPGSTIKPKKRYARPGEPSITSDDDSEEV